MKQPPVNTINIYGKKDYNHSNVEFKRFIANCYTDLKFDGITYCFTKEQVEAVKQGFKNLKIREEKDYYVLSVEQRGN